LPRAVSKDGHELVPCDHGSRRRSLRLLTMRTFELNRATTIDISPKGPVKRARIDPERYADRDREALVGAGITAQLGHRGPAFTVTYNTPPA
jgi:hypothetical protein